LGKKFRAPALRYVPLFSRNVPYVRTLRYVTLRFITDRNVRIIVTLRFLTLRYVTWGWKTRITVHCLLQR